MKLKLLLIPSAPGAGTAEVVPDMPNQNSGLAGAFETLDSELTFVTTFFLPDESDN
jgi:hypothetical protein